MRPKFEVLKVANEAIKSGVGFISTRKSLRNMGTAPLPPSFDQDEWYHKELEPYLHKKQYRESITKIMRVESQKRLKDSHDNFWKMREKKLRKNANKRRMELSFEEVLEDNRQMRELIKKQNELLSDVKVKSVKLFEELYTIHKKVREDKEFRKSIANTPSTRLVAFLKTKIPYITANKAKIRKKKHMYDSP